MSAENEMPGRLPKHCVEDVDRHGNVRVYLRRKGMPKFRLEGVPWTEPFSMSSRRASSFDAERAWRSIELAPGVCRWAGGGLGW